MLGFMDRVQQAFLDASGWNKDNSYAVLNSSSKALLDFCTPRGLRVHLSSISTPHFATSYSFGSLGVVDGSLAYLYSSLPLHLHKSSDVDLRLVTPGYNQLQELPVPTDNSTEEVWCGGERLNTKPTVLYGRMYSPGNTLEALCIRRISNRQLMRITAVSNRKLKHGGTVMAMLQQDMGKWSTEFLYSTDVALLGFRGLYNFGRDPRLDPQPSPPSSADKPVGRFSAGAEIYYGLINKSAGMSTGLRYATLPSHPGLPLTMTLTLNPLMGHLATTYAIRAGQYTSFASRYEFNMYSYESDVDLGVELWRQKADALIDTERTGHSESSIKTDTVGGEGVLKVKVNQRGELGVLWEGRIKELLFSVGGSMDFKSKDSVVKALGIEVQYSS